MFRPWKKFKHPQLGEVEIGGIAQLVGLNNPPCEILPEVCARQSAMYLRGDAMAPSLEMEVANSGYLPTYVLDSAKKLTPDTSVFVEVEPLGGGVTIDPRDLRTGVGHLEGWGRGLYNEYIFYQRSRGSVSRRTVSIPVRGTGRVRAEGLRVGEVAKEIAVE
ncbi:MAG TPA: hypothetical protein VE085_16430 [Burkholderiales bacterium]|nr:hypothetical protein [Burkholderiales bacterium]